MTAADDPFEVDPLLIADIEDLFTTNAHDLIDLIDEIEFGYAAIAPESFLGDVFAADCPEAAAAAYEQMVTGEWDGEL
ncbi:hypothetical protein [Streptomyces sp. NPDC088348]|uniref:hypothetical protein n=1 Tax=Streptomyces sp. NPDC088348 TaxID=3365853 RepID=UPI00382BA68F